MLELLLQKEVFQNKINKIIPKIDSVSGKIKRINYTIEWKWDIRRTWIQNFN